MTPEQKKALWLREFRFPDPLKQNYLMHEEPNPIHQADPLPDGPAFTAAEHLAAGNPFAACDAIEREMRLPTDQRPKDNQMGLSPEDLETGMAEGLPLEELKRLQYLSNAIGLEMPDKALAAILRTKPSHPALEASWSVMFMLAMGEAQARFLESRETDPMETDEHFAQGLKAFHDGENLISCPKPANTQEMNAWQSGWLHAERYNGFKFP